MKLYTFAYIAIVAVLFLLITGCAVLPSIIETVVAECIFEPVNLCNRD